jgi:alpha-L-arabinofuranosidase
MDWDHMCKDPSIWLTDEERNPAKQHVTRTTRNWHEATKLERARKATIHSYNKNEHLIFKYHCKASERRAQLTVNQKKRKLAEQISEAQAKLKQHLSPKERTKQEWNEWFCSVKSEDGKQADPNQDPDAHIIAKPPSSASLFQ